MVCIRCKMVVKSELDRLGLQYANIELGEAEIYGELTSEKKTELDTALKKQGLELMDDKKSQLIEKIKIIIIELIHYSDYPLKINLSDFLTSKLNYDYTYLANLFSEVQGTTIEKLVYLYLYHLNLACCFAGFQFLQSGFAFYSSIV